MRTASPIAFIYRVLAILLLGFPTSGCVQRGLMPTPNLYARGFQNPFAGLPPELQTTHANVIYFSDRTSQQTALEQFLYGHQRSRSLVAGIAQVDFKRQSLFSGSSLSWDQLLSNSLTADRTLRVSVTLGDARQLIRFPETPYPLVNTPQGNAVDPDVLRSEAFDQAFLRDLITARLERVRQKDLYIFIHGYNNSFSDAAVRMAELWHFMGRQGVPIIYSWPAGGGGLRGYFFDRESGEFTVYHLKQTLRRLASIPAVERIHILAHSRGCDVAISALRELVIEQRGCGRDPRPALKIANLVLAAPDLDFDVATQRISAENLAQGLGRMTIYVSEADRALGLANWLFGSVQRLGRLRFVDLSDAFKLNRNALEETTIIDARVPGDFLGHSYFHSDPAVSSDLILLLAHNLSAGARYGRPLEKIGPSYWSIYEKYPDPTGILDAQQ